MSKQFSVYWYDTSKRIFYASPHQILAHQAAGVGEAKFLGGLNGIKTH